jgi:hypothetical protein
MQLGRLPLCQLSYSRPGARRTSRGASKGTTRRCRATGATSDLAASRGAERPALRLQEDMPSCADCAGWADWADCGSIVSPQGDGRRHVAITPASCGPVASIQDVPELEPHARTALLDPTLHAAGWTEEMIRREETPGAVEIVEGRPRRAGTGRTDYTVRIKVAADAQPVAVAVVEAKRADEATARGLDQAKEYAREYARSAARLHVPFVYSTKATSSSSNARQPEWTASR